MGVVVAAIEHPARTDGRAIGKGSPAREYSQHQEAAQRFLREARSAVKIQQLTMPRTGVTRCR